MNRIYIIHRWDGSPQEPMYQWLKKEFKKEGYEVLIPAMPNASEPEIKTWVSHIKKIVGTVSKETYFIGHSIGCQSILRYMETLDPHTKIGGVIFIAPWMSLDENTIKEEGEEVKRIAKPWMETPINWKKVRTHTSKFVCIFSDNDPYVPLSNKTLFEKELRAKIIMEHNKGHFTVSDNIKENQTAVNELLILSKN